MSNRKEMAKIIESHGWIPVKYPTPTPIAVWKKRYRKLDCREHKAFVYIYRWKDIYKYNIEADLFVMRDYASGDMVESYRQLLFKGYIKDEKDLMDIFRMLRL